MYFIKCYKEQTAIVVEGTKKCINRIELNTSFNFNQVKQILLSDPIKNPHKENYLYVSAFKYIILLD